MNNQEAKFILGAYRPDGRDASDPVFAEPLAQSERDPELRTWLARERKFDTVVSGKLSDLSPPAGLREAILAGVRASQPRRKWWTNSGWFVMAAAAAVIAAVALTLKPSTSSPGGADFAAFATRDLAESHETHVGYPSSLAAEQVQIGGAALPITQNVKLDLADLQKKNCRAVRFAGREVFEICFQRDGTWYHLYAARRSDFASGTIDPHALLSTRGEYASTVWADSNTIYALVTHGSVDALRRVI